MNFKLLFLCFIGFEAVAAEKLCPCGWTGPTTTGKCYRIMHTKTSPLAAGKLCQDNGGALGSIKNHIEVDFVNTFVLPDAKDWVITGLEYVGGVGPWTWPDGTVTGFYNWGKPSENYNKAKLDNYYMYLYSRPSDKGTANYGKWYADHAGNHEVLCEAIPKDNENCGCGCNNCRCGC